MPTPQELNIPDKLDSILTTKQAIREAIVAKGVEISPGTIFREYANYIQDWLILLPESTVTFMELVPGYTKITCTVINNSELKVVNGRLSDIGNTFTVPTNSLIYVTFDTPPDDAHINIDYVSQGMLIDNIVIPTYPWGSTIVRISYDADPVPSPAY